MNIQDTNNIAYQINNLAITILDEIVGEVEPESTVYFESCFEEWSYNDENDKFPVSSSGLKIYLSKKDFENKNCFKYVMTSAYGTGGLYSWRSVNRCGLINRFNEFLFNEIKESYTLAKQSNINRIINSTDDISIEKLSSIKKAFNLNFVLIPLSLEQEERFILKNI